MYSGVQFRYASSAKRIHPFTSFTRRFLPNTHVLELDSISDSACQPRAEKRRGVSLGVSPSNELMNKL